MNIKLFVLFASGILALVSCSERAHDNNFLGSELERDAAKRLTISLGSFNDGEERSKLGNYLGSIRIESSNPNEYLKRRAIGGGDPELFSKIALCPIIYPNPGSTPDRFAIIRELPSMGKWSDLLSSEPTGFPLITQNSSYWGFTGPECHVRNEMKFKEFLSNLSEQVVAVDLTFFRVPEHFYEYISIMPNVRFMAMPWFLNIPAKHLKYPKNINELIIYNTRINGLFHQRSNELTKLGRLVLHGCWVDAPFSYTPIAAPKNFDRTVLPYGDTSKTIKSIEFINCDNRSFLSMLYFQWDNLQNISFRRGQSYTKQDGIEFIYVLYILIEKYSNQFPSLETISLQFGDLDQPITTGVLRGSEVAPPLRIDKIKQELDCLEKNASIDIAIEVISNHDGENQ